MYRRRVFSIIIQWKEANRIISDLSFLLDPGVIMITIYV